MWQAICDRGHATCHMQYVTHDMWQMGGGEPYLKMSAP